MTIEISLPPKLDHAASSTLLETLRAHSGTPLRIDASDAKGIGGLAAQIILAAVRKWRADRVEIEFIRSEAMDLDFQRLGMLDEIVVKEQEK